MDVELLQLSVTCIHELVGDCCRDNNNLFCTNLKRGWSDGEDSYSFEHDKDFLIRMLMQADFAARRHVNPDKGNRRVEMMESLKFKGASRLSTV